MRSKQFADLNQWLLELTQTHLKAVLERHSEKIKQLESSPVAKPKRKNRKRRTWDERMQYLKERAAKAAARRAKTLESRKPPERAFTRIPKGRRSHFSVWDAIWEREQARKIK